MGRGRGTRALLAAAGLVLVAILVAALLAFHGSHGPTAADDEERAGGAEGPPEGVALEGRPPSETGARGRATAGPTAPAGEARGPGTLRVRFLWKTSRAPLAHVSVDALHGDAVSVRRMVTDAEGRIVWEGAPAGALTLYVAVEAWFDVDVPSGGAVEQDLLVSEGIRVAGTVRDEGGRPVPGATVWLAQGGLSNQGNDAAVADRDGAYGFRIAATDACVGAHARGHGPSLWHFVNGQAGETVTQDLVLRGAGGSLRVRVVGPEGTPVPDAAVLVGTATIESEEIEGGVWANEPTAFHARTGAEGEAAFEGLPVGEQPVRVLARGHPLHEASVVIDADRPANLDVRLAARAVVAGTVVGKRGVPLGGVRVSRFLPSGEELPFVLSPAATSDAAGHYELDGLPLGHVEIEAHDVGSGTVPAHTVVVLSAGSTTWWDPVLTEGATIVGRLVDSSGRAARDWGVKAWSANWRRAGLRSSAAYRRTDAEGRFTLGGLLDLPHRLEAYAPEGGDVPVGSWPDVLPGGAERLFEVPADAARAGLRGRLVDSGGRLFRGGVLWVSVGAGAGPFSVPVRDEDGAFSVAPLAPGRYRLELSVPGRPTWDAGEHALQAGEQRDLGTVTLPPTGGLRVLVTSQRGVALVEVEVDLLQRGRTVYTAPVRGGVAGFSSVYAGGYRVELRGDVVGEGAACEVRAGVVTEVLLVASPGAQRVFAIRIPLDAAVPSRLHVEVVGPEGRAEVVEDRAVPDLGSTSRDADEEARTGLRPLAWSVMSLRPGAWSLRATTDTGLAATVPFRTDDAAPSAPIEVVLRSGR